MIKAHVQQRRWTHIRVRHETLANLNIEIDLLLAAVEAGHTPDPGVHPDRVNPAAKGISLDQMISMLIADRGSHRERRRAAAVRRRNAQG